MPLVTAAAGADADDEAAAAGAAAAAAEDPSTCTLDWLLLAVRVRISCNPMRFRKSARSACRACLSRSVKAAKDSFAVLRAAFFSRFAMLAASYFGFGPVPLRAPPLQPPSSRPRPTIVSSSSSSTTA